MCGGEIRCSLWLDADLNGVVVKAVPSFSGRKRQSFQMKITRPLTFSCRLRVLSIYLMIALQFLGGTDSRAQQVAWQNQLLIASKAAREKNYAEAEKQFLATLKLAESDGPIERESKVALTTETMAASVYCPQELYADAGALLERSFDAS